MRAMFVGPVPRPLFAALLWFLLLCWAGVVLWLSSLTPQELPPTAFMMWDKLNHFAAFAVGGWLAATALQAGRPGGSLRSRILAAILIVAVFGALDETRQLFTPGRSGADFYDWIADFLGASAGAILSVLTYGFLVRRLTRA
jgi:VanZ family protein